MFKLLSNFSFQTQVICTSVAINIITCLIFSLIFQMYFNYIAIKSQQFSLDLLSEQSHQELNYYSAIQWNSVMSTIDRNSRNIQIIKDLYYKLGISEHDIDQVVHPQQCTIADGFLIYSQYVSLCYMQYNNQSNVTLKLDLAYLITEYLVALDIEDLSYLYYLSGKQEGFLFQYPTMNEEGCQYDDEYYLANFNGFIPPYLSWQGGPVVMTIFDTLQEIDGPSQGIIGLDFFIQKTQNYYPDLYFYIQNSQGLLMLSDQYFTSEDQVFIYNQTQTGFNYNDWFDMQDSDSLTLFNTKFKQDSPIQIRKFDQYDFQIIVFQDTSSYIQQIIDLVYNLESWKQRITIIYVLILVCTIVLILIIQSIFIIKFTSALQAIISMIQNTWSRQTVEDYQCMMYMKLKLKHAQDYQLFYELILSLEKFLEVKQSKECMNIQEIQYPKRKTRALQINLKQLVDNHKPDSFDDLK